MGAENEKFETNGNYRTGRELNAEVRRETRRRGKIMVKRGRVELNYFLMILPSTILLLCDSWRPPWLKTYVLPAFFCQSPPFRGIKKAGFWPAFSNT
jgi:hypothetical protein